MKHLRKLKINILNEIYLEQKDMNILRGGAKVCGCSCYYANSGGSSSSSNSSANYNLGGSDGIGGTSTSGCSQYIYDDSGCSGSIGVSYCPECNQYSNLGSFG